MGNTVVKTSEYMVSYEEDQYIESEAGSMKCLEFEINEIPVRFITKELPIDLKNRKFNVRIIKQAKNELGEWEDGKEIKATGDDTLFVNKTTGEIATFADSHDVSDGAEILNRKGKSYAPKTYKKIKTLKAEYTTQAQFIIDQCTNVYDITSVIIERKINQIYN